MKEFEDLIKDVKQEIVTTNISLADRFKKMRSILNSCYENDSSLSEVDINNLTILTTELRSLKIKLNFLNNQLYKLTYCLKKEV